MILPAKALPISSSSDGLRPVADQGTCSDPAPGQPCRPRCPLPCGKRSKSTTCAPVRPLGREVEFQPLSRFCVGTWNRTNTSNGFEPKTRRKRLMLPDRQVVHRQIFVDQVEAVRLGTLHRHRDEAQLSTPILIIRVSAEEIDALAQLHVRHTLRQSFDTGDRSRALALEFVERKSARLFDRSNDAVVLRSLFSVL